MIEVRNLSKKYSNLNKYAVNSISFKLEKGEIGCIIGPSGCGKTTTLKMVNRLLDLTSGEIFVNNQPVALVDPVEWRRKIGYVVQKGALLPHLTVKENIAFLSKVLKRKKKDIDKRVEELMDIIGMPKKEFSHRYPFELSGGQVQRVAIARSLMEDPPVLLMDEPFGALDTLTTELLYTEFKRLNKKLKKTILIVTHDLDEAFKLGDKVILMNNGEIVQIGSKEDFVKNPATEYVKSFIQDLL